MFVEIGHLCLILTLMLALVQIVIPLVGANRGWLNWMKVADTSAILQFIFTTFGFLALVFAFVNSDFTVKLVALNSHSMKPLIYKIT